MSFNLTQKWLRQNLITYTHKDRLFLDFDTAISRFPTIRPKSDVYTYDDGRTQLLLCLHGLLPISFRGASYNIPIAVWITKDYPTQPPIVYVVPTIHMLVRPSKNVDVSGRCNFDYLQHWEKKSESCNLSALLEIMQQEFSRGPPVYAKQNKISPTTSSPTALVTDPPPLPPLPPKPAPTSPPPHKPHDLSPQYTSTEKLFNRPPPPLPSSSTSSPHTPEITGLPTYTIATPNLLDEEAFSLSSTMPQLPTTAPPRPPNPELLRLHAQVHDKITSEFSSLSQIMSLDAERLSTQQTDLLAGEPAIRDEMARLEAVRDVCNNVSSRLRSIVEQGERNIAELRRKGDPEVDELICSTSIVHNQLINLVAEDNAIEDTIYHLHRALNTSRIDLERFLRTTRVLAEEQFTKRALIEKIQLGIPIGTSIAYG